MSSDECACRMPIAIAGIEDDRKPTRKQHRKHDRIGDEKRGLAVEQRHDQMRRRKNQRLGISDLRMTAKGKRVPSGRITGRKGLRHEDELWIEMRFRIPWDRKIAEKPWRRERKHRERVDDDAPQKRPAYAFWLMRRLAQS